MLALSTVMDQGRLAEEGAVLVSTLAKGLDILALFAGGELLGNQQIVERTGLARATASRLTTTLTALGYLRFDEVSRKYAMGSRLLAMGACFQHRLGLLAVARPHMQELAQETGLTVGMGTRERMSIVCLDVVRPEGPRVGSSTVGTVMPMTTTAIGLSYLAVAALKERTQLLRKIQMRSGAHWPAERSAIEMAIGQYRRQGFVTRPRSCEEGVSGVGASLHIPAMNCIFSFNCAGHAIDLAQVNRMNQVGQALARKVASIGRALQGVKAAALS